jgi:hypothetical protein
MGKVALRSAAMVAAWLALVGVPTAMAGDYDGSKPLICAALQAISCQADGACKQGSVESLRIPQFFWVDVAAKTVGEKDPDGQIRKSPIESATQSATHLILQGRTERLGWSATVSKSSGRLVVTGADGASALVLFGACTPTS